MCKKKKTQHVIHSNLIDYGEHNDIYDCIKKLNLVVFFVCSCHTPPPLTSSWGLESKSKSKSNLKQFIKIVVYKRHAVTVTSNYKARMESTSVLVVFGSSSWTTWSLRAESSEIIFH